MSVLVLGWITCAFVAAGATPCSISGRVTDDRGIPANGVAVNAIWETMDAGNRVFGAVTNEQGAFCINLQPGNRHLPAGRYTVMTNGGTQPASASPRCTTCCAPATDLVSTVAASGAVLVAPGKPARNVNIRQRRAAVYCVRGEVRDSAGRPVRDVAMGLEMERRGTAVFLEGGRFLLTNLPPGSYTAVVTDHPQFGQVLRRQQFMVRDRNIAKLVIVVNR